jgi:hypothetical protein
MSVTPSPIGGFAAQFFDNNGVILSGGKIYTYAAGTTTPQATYTSASGTTPHANPIILDSAGRVPGGEIWLTDGLVYKFVIETATGILLGTYDNITGVNSNFVNYTVQEEVITATAGQTVFNLSTINYTPGTNSLSVYIDGVNQYVGDSYLETDSDTVTFTSGVHVGGEVKFTTAVQTTTGAVDASIVSYDPPFAGSVATNVEAKLAQTVSVMDFGATGDGVTDDTAAIQAALDIVGPKTVVIPAGEYLITSLEVTEQFTTIQSDTATLLLSPTGAQTHALKLSTNFLTITGSLIFDGGLNSNYDSTLWIKGGYGRYDNITFRRCKLAIRIGENGVNQVSLSEMFFNKCVTNQCRNGLEMYGLFTVGSFTDCVLVGGEDAAWNGQDVTTVKNFGGRIYAENSYFYGAETDDYPIFELNQVLYDGLYYTGYISLSQCESEVYGKPFIWVNNLSAVNNAVDSGGVTLTNCRLDFYNYAALSPQPDFFRFNNYFTGRFVTKNNQFRFTQPLNKRPFALGANTQAQINFEDMYREGAYYGTNAASYPGLPPQVPFQTVLSVTRNAAFTAGLGTAALPLLFDTVRTGINGNRIVLADYYNTATGVFTVPPGGLSSIMVVANYIVSGALGAAPAVWVNYTSTDQGFSNRRLAQSKMIAGGGQAIAIIPEASPGDEISFVMYTDNAGAALDVTSPFYNEMTISAYITTPNA